MGHGVTLTEHSRVHGLNFNLASPISYFRCCSCSKRAKPHSSSTAVCERMKAELKALKDACNETALRVSSERMLLDKQNAKTQPVVDEAVMAVSTMPITDVIALRDEGKNKRGLSETAKRLLDCVILLRYKPINPIEWSEGYNKRQFVKPSYDKSIEMLDESLIDVLAKFGLHHINAESIELLQVCRHTCLDHAY